ncbi:MAG: cytochrome c biogenesis protein CcsA [Brumimicrobium sp.]|nr:cytochrome c biogenesis protein CcsA [Brumimicrobium sp.]
MTDKILKELFSMKLMAIGMIIFAISIAVATFIESDYGTPASKIAIYDAKWFEILLIYLSINLIVNIVAYRMWQKSKIPTFIFHFSFLLCIIGAGLTRYVGYEGQMMIGNGETTDIIYSNTPYFTLKANDGVNQYTYQDPHWLSEGVANPIHLKIQLPNQKKVKVDYVSYKENMVETLVDDASEGRDAIEFVVQGESQYIFKGEEKIIGGTNVMFETNEETFPGVHIYEKDGQLLISSAFPYQRVNMASLSVEDRMNNNIPAEAISQIAEDTLIPFISGNLYNFGRESTVFKSFHKSAALQKVKSPEKDGGNNYLTIKLSTDTESKLVDIQGSPKHIIKDEFVQFAGLNFQIGYGAKPIKIPFYIKNRKFELDKYPGSNMASSFASEVTVIDSAHNVFRDQRIFMNRVMDYRGYRFFQSSYFADQSGTILSVNYDWWGTTVTYIAYFLMGLGFFLSIFNPKGRIKELNTLVKKSRENRAKMLKVFVLLISIGLTSGIHAQVDSTALNEEVIEEHHDHDHNHDHANEDSQENHTIEVHYLSEKDAANFDDLLVQDYDGRIIPFHTLADKILRKLRREDHYDDKTAVQTLLAMHLYGPDGWNSEKILYVSYKIRDALNLEKYVSINDLEAKDGNFKWYKEYEEAHGKTDASKSEYDKELIKLGERYRILKEIFQFQYLRIIPIPDDDNGTWTWPFAREMQDKDQTNNAISLNLLRSAFLVSQGDKSVSMDDVKKNLQLLKDNQWKELKAYEATHPSIGVLTHKHVNVEIMYNKLKAFDKIQSSYFFFGFILMIIFFIRTLMTPTLKSEKILSRISYVFLTGVILTFLFHAVGLGMRWYITGHAPWSDGYEAVIFISWATILAGLFFVKKNPAVIAATTLFAAVMLFVTQLNMLDPEITPLEPVLKSYWLMIHVAVITSSYGFLGISAVLGFVNMILYLAVTKKNRKRLQMNIIELTAVSEMVMIVGLFMLTMGTFLGGVWANESWGRYWGWDPKETWALVSMLVFATIIHLRWIPKLSSRFLFNVLSLWGYSAILFTFFGVNFILVGLHSYAQGDGVAKLPLSAWLTILFFTIFTLAVITKYMVDNKKDKVKENDE